jgi:hypothetical protein
MHPIGKLGRKERYVLAYIQRLMAKTLRIHPSRITRLYVVMLRVVDDDGQLDERVTIRALNGQAADTAEVLSRAARVADEAAAGQRK